MARSNASNLYKLLSEKVLWRFSKKLAQRTPCRDF